MSVTWRQGLAWRLGQQLLEPVGDAAAVDVVRRLVAVPAAGRADVAVAARQADPQAGQVAAALAEGTLIMGYALRGASHLMAAEHASDVLAVRAASRMWERRSWREHYDLEPSAWPDLRATVRDALTHGPLTREQLGEAVTREPRFAHLAPAFTDPAHSLLKPLVWQGDMSFGPTRDGRITFRRLDANPHWAGPAEPDEAGPRVVAAYVHAYGPATLDNLDYWLGQGLGAGRKRVRAWIAELSERLATVDVGGEQALVLAEDAGSLADAEASDAVRLLPGHDQWVLGPGTDDAHVVPPVRRAAVSRGADLVVAGGVVSGTWKQHDTHVVVSWFDEAGAPPETALAEETERLGGVLGVTGLSVERAAPIGVR